ncbi:carboxypeptidase-like regulatory domain-containing protein [Aequorivita sp. F47161]|uniref:Carboxypeptidase-like regulatory domain-containing protein n=1 Tax=Aequorivita vitellina TaxID=2874475 RepID=A0A9X1R0Y1_9FLAO|nr:carboxypeptidase-like regulatory domain-containing protein [Aequorivita vitellina]MCG2420179.1 carboxypeptidase-like regulatory domain-containing protein [Aequorivita vitellina]
MKKSITIRIPEPCHEDWAKMTTTEKGKFCGVCTKEVFDFTSKTDEEVVKFLSQNKNACGRLKKSQLNREVKLERKSGQSFAPIAASMLLPLTLLSNNPKTETNSLSEKPMISLGIGRFSNGLDRIQIVTEGIVTDENGVPLRNVEITSNETGAREWTNKKGEYRIVTLDNEQLEFKLKNYISKEIALSNSSKTIAVSMNREVIIESFMLGKIAPTIEKPVKKDSISNFTKGVVVDDTGLPLPGANIKIKGTSTGTQTDFDGNYSIETKPGDVLVFSYVGFETKEISVSKITNIVNLEMSGAMMGEVVITGGISYNDYYEPEKDPNWYEKAKAAYKNTIKFRKLKRARKKAARKNK